MQKTVFIIGDITKDVYIRLDNRRNQFLSDETGTYWLNLPFNNQIHRYFKRTSILGGTAVSAEVLHRFGLVPSISAAKIDFDSHGDFVTDKNPYSTYRYILCKDNDTVIFAPSNVYATILELPVDRPDYIYLDRPSILGHAAKASLAAYLDDNPKVKLVYWANRDVLSQPSFNQTLAERSELIFISLKDLGLENTPENINDIIAKLGSKNILIFAENDVYAFIDGVLAKTTWSLGEKDALFTSLTTKATIAASFLAASILGQDLTTCLLLAKYNVEKSTLNKSRSLEILYAMIKNQEYEVTMLNEKPNQNLSSLENVAQALVAAGKGILAADESGGSIHKKFESRNIEDTEANRRAYRNLMFTTPDLENYVNGVILFDETAHQTADDGTPFQEFLAKKGIIPGIKVDKGLEDIPGSTEKITLGLDDLKPRLQEYAKMGLKFAKWRAAFEITNSETATPSNDAITANAKALARYALSCQEAGIVPIVEPELVYDGDYSLEQAKQATSRILQILFSELELSHVNLKGLILKVNMVLTGKKFTKQSTTEELAAATAEVLKAEVPANVAGVVFLSGGQTPDQATENLAAITKQSDYPWPLTFSFARALQDPLIDAWQGNPANTEASQTAFKARLIANTEALKK